MSQGHQLAMALRGAYWALHRRTDAILLPLGVTANQFVLLSLLDDDEGVTQRELCQRASSDPNTVRAMLVNLEAKSLVTREPHPTDRRAWRVSLTREGKRLFKQLWSETETLRNELTAGLTPREADSLLVLLGRLSQSTQSPL